MSNLVKVEDVIINGYAYKCMSRGMNELSLSCSFEEADALALLADSWERVQVHMNGVDMAAVIYVKSLHLQSGKTVIVEIELLK